MNRDPNGAVLFAELTISTATRRAGAGRLWGQAESAAIFHPKIDGYWADRFTKATVDAAAGPQQALFLLLS